MNTLKNETIAVGVVGSIERSFSELSQAVEGLLKIGIKRNDALTVIIDCCRLGIASDTQDLKNEQFLQIIDLVKKALGIQ